MTLLDDRPAQAPPAGRPGRWAGRRAVLRLARRDAARHRARSALVVAMIALPVLGLTAVDVVARTEASGNAASDGSRTLPPGVDAELSWQGGGRVEQSPDGSSASISGDGSEPPPDADRVRRDTGAIDVLPVSFDFRRVVLPDGRSRGVELVETDLREPLAASVVGEVVQGRAPEAPDEVVVTATTRGADGGVVGNVLQLAGQDRALQVVGTVRLVGDRGSGAAPVTAVGLPGTFGGSSPAAQQYVLRTESPLLWEDVLRLNEQGYLVVSRAVLDDPPPDAEVPVFREPVDADDRLDVAAFVVLAAGMGLLEVVLLAGPAFAVGARRSRRMLALVAATGGDRRQVRDVVLAQGLVLGLIGAGVGLALGVAAGAAALPVLERIDDITLPGPVVRPLNLLAIGSVGLVTAVLAAMLPARGASRQDVALALAGRREPVRVRARVPVVGLLLAAAGLAVVLVGVDQRSPLAILSGAALGQVGLVVCTPSVVRLLGRTGGRLPLTARLAVRDAARNVGRTAPAVAAVMAAVAGTVASSIFAASLSARDERSYVPQLPVGQLQVQVDPASTPTDLALVERTVRDVVPVTSLVAVQVTDGRCESGTGCTSAFPEPPVERQCPLARLGRPATAEELAAADSDVRCTGVPFARRYFDTAAVDDGSGLEVLLGAPDPAGAEVLARGGAVAVDPGLLTGGVVRLRIVAAGGASPDRDVDIPAVAAKPPPGDWVLPAQLVLSPALAEELGIDAAVRELRAVPARPVTTDEQEALGRALADQDLSSFVDVERGYVDLYRLPLLALVAGAALVTVGAVATSTALAMTDARPDLATMAAVGASGSVRRRMAVVMALLLAGLGTALGAVAGVVPAVAAIRALRADGVPGLADGGWPLVVPWGWLAVTALLVPLAAGLLVALFTRSRLPVMHRRDA